MNNPIFLGVNIDHIATLRQVRKTNYPDPIYAAFIAEQAGADGITVHLREDRRHIQERDVRMLKDTIETRLNLEMAATEEMLKFAEQIRPTYCCLVPEKREELTTEGGLNIVTHVSLFQDICARLKNVDIQVSLFIDPDIRQIDAAVEVGTPLIEIHTGCYAEAPNEYLRDEELHRIAVAVQHAREAGLIVNAGHGLHYHNVSAIAQIKEITELNIGHGIIARACFTGLYGAVKEMKTLMMEARR